MYRKLLASTALALVVTGGAYAQEMAPADPAMAPAEPMMETPAEPETPQEPLVSAEETGINADGWLATEIIGETIYNSTGDDAEAIGDVNDFVLDQNGEIGAVVVGVGGFLGIGQKSVAINWSDLELSEDMDGNNRLVASMTREQLENAAEFDRQEWLASESAAAAEMDSMGAGDAMAPAPAGDAMAPAAPADDAMATEEAAPADDAMASEEAAPADDAMASEEAAPADDAMAAEEAAPADDAMASEEAAPAEDAMATEEAPAEADAAAAADFDSMESVATTDISADELTGTAVYGAGDEEIGSIGDILLSEDGTVDAVVIDFGGFLGIATKPVAVAFDNLTFVRDENGGLILRTPLTAEELEAAPEYDEEAYLSAPEDNSLIVE
ncbi:MAG TPA: photosystem reaction center subunit H [Pelagibacterium sp.]|uniref:PRC-barrel domain-containing protein n=1 Tax=uncultured Pelagibacterium sp. TaxID=1159875 RepID=UPI000EDB81A2|nr:photosystem reaction center subunit H [Pelagibacterium sp.]|tara:strand:- start:3029 stop:4183 length:1155 start_codon:yes stop_codon:yes gene_type:complete